jgi:hypothetical protein
MIADDVFEVGSGASSRDELHATRETSAARAAGLEKERTERRMPSLEYTVRMTGCHLR